MEWSQQDGVCYSDAAVSGSIQHGESEYCYDLCGGPWGSDAREFQTPVTTGRDLNAGSSQDGAKSSLNVLNAVSGSYISFTSPAEDVTNYSTPFTPYLSTPGLSLLSPSPRPSDQPSNSPTSTKLSTSQFNHKELPDFQCCICRLELPGIHSALKHIKENHLDRVVTSRPTKCMWPCIQAEGCSEAFENYKDLLRHVMDMHLDIKYTCACGKRHRNDRHLAHIQAPHQVNPAGFYICVCGKSIDSTAPNSLADYIRHVREKLFTCPCGLRLSFEDHFSHVQQGHQCQGEAQYVCVCGRATDSVENHRNHIEERCTHGPFQGPDGHPRRRGRPPKRET